MKSNFLKKFRHERFFCSLDIGASSLKASLIKAKDPFTHEILGVCENKIFGFKDAFVTDLAEFSECINGIINQIAKQTGIKIQDLQIGISSQLIEMRTSSAIIPLIDKGSKVIISRDIKKINEHARLLGVKMDEEILHEIIQSYQADDVNLGANPLGLYGRKLGVQILLIIANVNKIRNIIKAVNQVGYDIDNICYSSYAASEVVLSEQEKTDGCVLIDIGTNFTSVFIFRQKTLKFFGHIEIGGYHFTKSIAEELNIPFDLAEQIKKTHADVLSSPQRLEEDILIKRESAYLPLKRGTLYNTMEKHTHMLTSRITSIIGESGYGDLINCGITVVGGGAALNGLIERIAQATNTTVKLGNIHIQAQENFGNGLLYSPVVGVAVCGYKKSIKDNLFYSAHNGWKKDILNKMMEIYQEYF